MDILIALIPSLCWGSIGLLSAKFGGNSSQQTLGLTFGGLFFGILTYIAWVIPHGYTMTGSIFVIGLISGILWTIGQGLQFLAIKSMGVSRAVPLSMTSQIVGNALLGAAVLGEWSKLTQWILGLIAIALIVLGAVWINAKDKSQKQSNGEVAGRSLAGMIPLLFSTLGFMGYFITPRLMQNWMHIPASILNADHGVQYMITMIFPQSIGMVIGGILFVLFITRETKNVVTKVTFVNAITGLVWAVGNIALFVSIANPNLGQATAATLSSLGFIMGAFGGVFILHEQKTKYQMTFVTLGTLLAVIGAIVMTNLNTLANMF